SAEFTIGEGELMAHDVPLGCAPDEYDDLISGTCSHLPYFGITTVYAIDSDYHVKSDLVKASYSSLWLEMGGEKQARGWYKLPAQEIKKSLEEVKSKHRSQFIKREGVKELIQLEMANALRQITLNPQMN
ncbi:DUF535 family protein, partial [Klebsiella quasipneumoniae subsp. similipneumoniae]|uniref:DUF535 family protein n=1 Tax=Klebsiella quasipneumoniae TaxID=1463165 RepID=UPI0038D08401